MTSCPAIGCPERNSSSIFIKPSQNTLCYVFKHMWRFEEVLKSLKSSLDRPPEALKNGRFWNFLGCPAVGAGARNSRPIFLNPSEKSLCNVFDPMWRFEEVPTSLRVFFFRRPETSRDGFFGRVFSAPFESCSPSLSILCVPLALRARCDHVFTLLIKKCRITHVLQVLSARRGCLTVSH